MEGVTRFEGREAFVHLNRTLVAAQGADQLPPLPSVYEHRSVERGPRALTVVLAGEVTTANPVKWL